MTQSNEIEEFFEEKKNGYQIDMFILPVLCRWSFNDQLQRGVGSALLKQVLCTHIGSGN